MLLKNCPHCGARVSGKSAFCPECGYRFEEIRTEGRNIGGCHNKLRFGGVLAAAFLIALFTLLVLHSQRTAADGRQSGQTVNSGTLSGTEAAAQHLSPAAQGSASSDTKSEEQMNIPEELLGSYAGDDGSGLTFYADGTAVYYSDNENFSEQGDPWYYRDGRVTMELAKLHCSITADTAGGFSRLFFESESENWINESFKKLPQEEKKYKAVAARSGNKALSVNEDGSYNVTFQGMSVRIPRHFYTVPSELDSYGNSALFGDATADTPYIGGMAFVYGEFDALTIDDWFDGYAAGFAMSFLDNVKTVSFEKERINGVTAYIAEIEGTYNKTSQGAAGRPANGYVVFYVNRVKKTAIKVIMSQLAIPEFDNRPEFQEIIHSVSVSDPEWQQ